MRRHTVLALAVALTAAIGGGEAFGQAPTLDGELLTQNTAFSGSTTGHCTTNPTDGTTTYSLTHAGTATGPYPGTFTESVSVKIGPASGILPLGPFPGGFPPGSPNPSQFISAGQLLTFNASFSIASAAGNVTGTKRLAAVVTADATHAGVCAQLANAPSPAGPVTGVYKDARAFNLVYNALITTADGTFGDSGDSQAQSRQGHIENAGGVVSDVNDFGESFDSDLAQTRALRMVGKGAVTGAPGGAGSHAYIVRCDSAANTGAPLEVRFGAQRFRLTGTSAVSCTNDPAVATPAIGFDTMTGSGTGTLTVGGPGTIRFKFVDAGAGGAGDSAEITIRNSGGTIVFQGSATPPGQFPGSDQSTGNNTAQAVPAGGGTT